MNTPVIFDAALEFVDDGGHNSRYLDQVSDRVGKGFPLLFIIPRMDPCQVKSCSRAAFTRSRRPYQSIGKEFHRAV